ncbi:NADH-cytochrome b5 reductase [Seminavis robusta]|uniref:NADH-cytochrome b5 reductase n=1 Tax=Seminavis robusta TaxID=568900 RepID=A0A9N8EJT8_9STRA|nr:NADH-cytochrome b5 reductase [Seminavis robusta]|eukprot:Sro1263_g257210.1 NADH-cytochrome b5 reductase (282) ;mRNA; f:12274-13119
MSSFGTSPSLTGKPNAVLVPPGQCQFNEDFQSVKLLERTHVSPTSCVVRFSLSDESKPLGLSTCSCVLAKAKTAKDPEGVIRPYTPISTNEQVGSFDLLIKSYGDDSLMSKHMCQDMAVGDTIEFKQIPVNIKIQAPFPYKKVGMLVGGTGLTPMVQALHAILGSSDAPQESVAMLYGSRDAGDILGKDLLDVWTKDCADKFSVTHVLSHEPNDSDWKGERGFINKELIQKHLPSPDEEGIIIFVCGPPPMYNALCGPREEKEVGGVLGEMGYKPEQVYKF